MRGRNNDVGLVRAFDSFGTEIATYTSGVLEALDTFEVATINRTEADISYLLIGGDDRPVELGCNYVIRLDKYNTMLSQNPP